MNVKNYKGFNNPLVYIFIVFILSSFIYELYSKNKLLAIFYTCSFFVFLFYFKGVYITSILILFFIVALNNIICFYSYTPSKVEKIRIIEVKNFYGKGKIDGRIVNLSNIDKGIEVGNTLLVKGEFTGNKNIGAGIIGDYKIENYKVLKPDLIDKLYKRRMKVFKSIENKLGKRKASLITSVSFGYKSELNEDYKELMKNLGISHVISISGLQDRKSVV